MKSLSNWNLPLSPYHPYHPPIKRAPISCAFYDFDPAQCMTIRSPIMQPITFESPCPGTATGMPGYLFVQLIQTLLATQCEIGNPSSYPADHAGSLRSDDQFDFIIVGGGSAGSVIANRLSEVSDWRVLVVEAGDVPNFESNIPGFGFSLLGSEMDWKYKAEPGDKACLSMEERRCSLAKGKALGGSSSINLMHYIRGNRDDYDEWQRLGNPGWGYDDVLPYFKKSEGLHKDFSLDNDTNYDETIRLIRRTIRGNDKSIYEFSKLFPEAYHSQDGILPVNHFSYDFYLSTLKKVYCYALDDLGISCMSDVNGLSQLGFVPAVGTIKQGSRMNSAHVFLPKDRTNLFVARNVHANKILVKNGRAVGVEVTRKNGEKVKLMAKREVIVSAGTFNTPKLLMLSGIGPAEHLRSVGVSVERDLPGVGQNLQAHVTFFGFPVSIDRDLPEPLKLLQKHDGIYEFLTRGSGLYGNLCMNDVIGFVATEEKSSLPDVQFLHFLNHLNDTYFFNELFRGLGLESAVTDVFAEHTAKSKVLLVSPTLLRPKSRGRVELRSSSPADPPKIHANLLSKDEDVATLIRGIRLAMRIIKSESFESVQAEPLRLNVSGCEDYKFDSSEYWECLVRHVSSPMYSYAGTCRMGTEKDGGVVDHTLKVHGVTGLRVADSSIMPDIIRGSTHIASIMIGEKVSDMIKSEYKKKAVHDEM